MIRKIILDTNVLLISIPKRSKYRVIFDKLLKGEFELIISNEILSEYGEIIAQKTSEVVSKNVCELLLTLGNVTKVDIYYKWDLIKADPDDNKFTDCAIAANADLLVSSDNHFQILKDIEFPRLTIVKVEDFLQELTEPKDNS